MPPFARKNLIPTCRVCQDECVGSWGGADYQDPLALATSPRHCRAHGGAAVPPYRHHLPTTCPLAFACSHTGMGYERPSPRRRRRRQGKPSTSTTMARWRCPFAGLRTHHRVKVRSPTSGSERTTGGRRGSQFQSFAGLRSKRTQSSTSEGTRSTLWFKVLFGLQGYCRDSNLAIPACFRPVELRLRPNLAVRLGGSARVCRTHLRVPYGPGKFQPSLSAAGGDPGRSCLLRGLVTPRCPCAIRESRPVPPGGPASDITASDRGQLSANSFLVIDCFT